jgi:predicted 3-demethylubiquinone-9 3-methyltransferase (glyoxalase superfamily)
MNSVHTQTITPFLWFDGQVEEAIDFYMTIFANAKKLSVMPGPNGTVMGANFELNGQRFMALNGGPQYKFTPAISFYINCETQQEVDQLWEKLSAGGRTDRCGWLQDKFGLSWQIVPSALPRLLQDKDPGKRTRVLNAMMKMTKLDIAGLEQA